MKFCPLQGCSIDSYYYIADYVSYVTLTITVFFFFCLCVVHVFMFHNVLLVFVQSFMLLEVILIFWNGGGSMFFFLFFSVLQQIWKCHIYLFRIYFLDIYNSNFNTSRRLKLCSATSQKTITLILNSVLTHTVEGRLANQTCSSKTEIPFKRNWDNLNQICVLLMMSFITILQPSQYVVSAAHGMVVETLWYLVLVRWGEVTFRAQAGFRSVEEFQQKTETHNFCPVPLLDSASCLKLMHFCTTFVYWMKTEIIYTRGS